MSRTVKSILVTMWIVAFSVVFAAIWLRSPALWFINLPESVWKFLTSVFGASCCESVADLEVVVGIGFGLFFALVTLGIVILSMKSCKRLTRRSSGR